MSFSYMETSNFPRGGTHPQKAWVGNLQGSFQYLPASKTGVFYRSHNRTPFLLEYSPPRVDLHIQSEKVVKFSIPAQKQIPLNVLCYIWASAKHWTFQISPSLFVSFCCFFLSVHQRRTMQDHCPTAALATFNIWCQMFKQMIYVLFLLIYYLRDNIMSVLEPSGIPVTDTQSMLFKK